MSEQRDFEVIARQVVEPVRRYLARRTDAATAADVLSEVLLVLWRRPAEVPTGAPLPHAYAVARNRLHDAQRAATRRQQLVARIAVIDPPVRSAPPHHDRSEDLHDRGVDGDAVRDAVEALPPASAEVVRLWAWEQLSPAEIAVVVGSSADAVGIRLHRAEKRLVEALGPPAPSGDRPHGSPDRRPEHPTATDGTAEVASGSDEERRTA